MSAARFSPCRRYRYTWTERVSLPLGTPAMLCFCMLNPSTADELGSDPTITRCMDFAMREGFDEILVVNAFAYRATKPRELREVQDPVGPDNDRTLIHIPKNVTTVVAWGADPMMRHRASEVVALLDRELFCLGKNEDGSPGHPLYLPKTRKLVPWSL